MKYFFFDIDGTLLSEVDHQLPDSTKRTLQLLKDHGHFIAIATSRPYCLTTSLAKEIDILNYVCDGGDGIVIDDEIIEILPLNLQDCLELAKESIKHNILIATSIDTTNNRYSPDHRFIETYPHLKDAFNFVTDTDFNVLESKSIHKMCLLCKQEQEYLLPSLKKVPHYRIDEQCILVEAMYKYKGIEKMIKFINGHIDDVVVFGDGVNDIDMLKKAPMSIAMGNAKDIVKQSAKYVTDKASDDGIYKACKHFKWI